MHELSIADAIVRIACAHARGRRVVTVEVRLGHLRQAVPGSLEYAFGLLAAGTPIEGARLEIVEVPVRVACGDCDATTQSDGFPLLCGACGSRSVEVIAGDECHVEALEVEDEALVAPRR